MKSIPDTPVTRRFHPYIKFSKDKPSQAPRAKAPSDVRQGETVYSPNYTHLQPSPQLLNHQIPSHGAAYSLQAHNPNLLVMATPVPLLNPDVRTPLNLTPPPTPVQSRQSRFSLLCQQTPNLFPNISTTPSIPPPTYDSLHSHKIDTPASKQDTKVKSSQSTNMPTNTGEANTEAVSLATNPDTGVKGSSRKQIRKTQRQIDILEQQFMASQYLTPEKKLELAKVTGLKPSTILYWFQNKRRNDRKSKVIYDSL